MQPLSRATFTDWLLAAGVSDDSSLKMLQPRPPLRHGRKVSNLSAGIRNDQMIPKWLGIMCNVPAPGQNAAARPSPSGSVFV